MPASSIYEQEALSNHMDLINRTHIYLIGLLPDIAPVDARSEGEHVNIKFSVADQVHELRWRMPPRSSLEKNGEQFYLLSEDGQKLWPSLNETLFRLNDEANAINFEVQYIGQAFGKSGERSTLDRLLKHETLQKISLRGSPPGYSLHVLLLDIEDGNSLVTLFDGRGTTSASGERRYVKGLMKLHQTSDQERVTLFEASLIRYFAPKFNKEFKDTFPSTNLKILADCYEKDISALVAEICIEELPLKICSIKIQPLQFHIIKHDLHDDENRRLFFFEKN